jgi:hypothetical protein
MVIGLLQHQDKELVDENTILPAAWKLLTCSAVGSTTLQDLDVEKGRGDPPALLDVCFKPLT